MNEIQNIAALSLSLMDLTSLTNEETDQDIISLCQQANSSAGNTAAICIYPRFVPIAKAQLAEQNTPSIKIATVTNFPHGNSDINEAVNETLEAVKLGADEVDVVFPYKALIEGNENIGFDLVKACKEACGANVLLKVIIESGELTTPTLIKKASELSINAGADFIKTSTGKVPVNATVRNAEDAKVYLDLAKEILGKSWLNASHFRFGASSLLNSLLVTLDQSANTNNTSSY